MMEENLGAIETECDYDMGAVIHGEGVVTNLTYHLDGRWLLMTTNENSLHLIDSFIGRKRKKIYAKTTGVGKVAYTHISKAIYVICACMTIDISDASKDMLTN